MTGVFPSLFEMVDQQQKLIECEVFSCLRQMISCFFMEYQERMGMAATHPVAIQAYVGHFNLGPVDNQCLPTLTIQIAGNVVPGTTQYKADTKTPFRCVDRHVDIPVCRHRPFAFICYVNKPAALASGRGQRKGVLVSASYWVSPLVVLSSCHSTQQRLAANRGLGSLRVQGVGLTRVKFALTLMLCLPEET